MILHHLIIISLLSAAIPFAHGLSASKIINTQKDSAFLARFVYGPGDNSLFEYNIKFPVITFGNSDPDVKTDSDSDHADAKTNHADAGNATKDDAIDEPAPAAMPLARGGASLVANTVLDDDIVANLDTVLEDDTPKEYIPFYTVVIYNDAEDQWPYVRKNEDKLTCQERQRVATEGGMVVFTLNPNSNPACELTSEYGIQWVHCRGERSWVLPDEPRWWFVTLTNCGTHPEPGVHALVSLNMTNGEGQGGLWEMLSHFSADKKWLLLTDLVALVVTLGFMAVAVVFWIILAKKRLLHVTFKLYVASLVLQFFALAFLNASLVDYSRDGSDSAPKRTVLGHVLSWLGSLLFAINAILVGKGYTVTRGRISTLGSIKLTIYTMVYCGAYMATYMYVYVLADERDTMYLYDSLAGYFLIGLRCLGAFWLLYAVSFTIKHFPDKVRFYVMYTGLIGLWFLAEPFLILITNYFFDAHNRAQVVNAGYWFITLAGHAFWVGLFVPCDINRNFPYHVRTNQIGFFDGEEQADKYRLNDNEEFSGVVVDPQDAPSTSAGPPIPMINNFFQSTGRTPQPVQKKPDISMFLATDWEKIGKLKKTASQETIPKPKTRDTPVGTMPAMKTNYSIFEFDTGFTPATLVVPASPLSNRDQNASNRDSNQQAAAKNASNRDSNQQAVTRLDPTLLAAANRTLDGDNISFASVQLS